MATMPVSQCRLHISVPLAIPVICLRCLRRPPGVAADKEIAFAGIHGVYRCLISPFVRFCAIVVVVSLPTFPLQTTGGRGCVTPPQAMGENWHARLQRTVDAGKTGKADEQQKSGKSTALNGRRRRRAWYVVRHKRKKCNHLQLINEVRDASAETIMRLNGK